MTEQEIRLELTKIIARNADEPHKTVDEIIKLFILHLKDLEREIDFHILKNHNP